MPSPKAMASKPKPTVLVPLYIYPLTEQTWAPLYDAITCHPNVNFLVIVNPNSGPGGIPLPSHDYVREIPKLNAAENVYTVGYIRVHYCKRPISEVYDEIDTYAGWAKDFERSGLGVKGILLDETPNHFSKERAEYLDALRKHIKLASGILGDRLLIHNPGTPPDAELAPEASLRISGPDVVITSEEPYVRFHSEEVQKRLKDYHYDRARSGYLISGIPKDEIGEAVRELSDRGAFIFATDLVEDFYESFGESWTSFVAAIDAE
ncbi:cell surface protein [Clohesyomyces aquaticus]|uniref:Cell surface protein n=1 Tax=Clohesyomyces aquaticus TaxID=1231657 RepID=A0A1Y2A9M4_9PLEO|nr:cell surface protein [Clohesyomyces aquaticus]